MPDTKISLQIRKTGSEFPGGSKKQSSWQQLFIPADTQPKIKIKNTSEKGGPSTSSWKTSRKAKEECEHTWYEVLVHGCMQWVTIVHTNPECKEG